MASEAPKTYNFFKPLPGEEWEATREQTIKDGLCPPDATYDDYLVAIRPASYGLDPWPEGVPVTRDKRPEQSPNRKLRRLARTQRVAQRDKQDRTTFDGLVRPLVRRQEFWKKQGTNRGSHSPIICIFRWGVLKASLRVAQQVPT